jgi:hypothetical protein
MVIVLSTRYKVRFQIRETKYEVRELIISNAERRLKNEEVISYKLQSTKYEVGNTLVEGLFHRACLPAAEGSVYFHSISIVFHFRPTRFPSKKIYFF